MFKKAVLILGLLALGGCKLHVIALKGGEVQSPTGAGTCLENSNCFHDITDTSFTESFEAVPAPGYEFVKWYGGEGFQCRNSINPICTVNSTLLAGLVSDTQIAAANDIYIMPIFQPEGAPITDTVIADSKEWAQPSLFAGVTREQVEERCPGGTCAGPINGHNTNGWNWAAATEVAQMLDNSYGVEEARLFSGFWFECLDVMDLFLSTWKSTPLVGPGDWDPILSQGAFPDDFSRSLSGFVQDAPDYPFQVSAWVSISSESATCLVGINSELNGVGAWLYRTP
jgi:hypothetical protein